MRDKVVPEHANADEASQSCPPFPPVSVDTVAPGVGTIQAIDRIHPSIDGYEIVELLGEGGMGVVWKAIQKSTSRPVALKLMSARLFGEDPRRQRRFEREVELAAQLEHPNIVRVYDSGIGRGFRYYVMELVDGVPLNDYLKHTIPSQVELLQLMREICGAVEHAHQHGVIHRDLKPSNVMIDKEGRPRLLDFGLAAPTDNGKPLDTVTVDAIGTIAYMSPEQAAGDAGKITTCSDVYSLGVILYEMLIGQLPHDSTGSPFSVLRRVADEPIIPPCSIVRNLDRELEAIVIKALARNPAERYDTPGQLSRDIQRFLDGEVVTARKLTATYVWSKWLKKHRWRVATACVVITVIVTTGIVSYVRVSTAKSQAVREARRAEESLYFNSITLAHRDILENNVSEAQRILKQCPPKFRHWEWYYLNDLSDSSEMTLASNGQTISAVESSFDGNEIISFGIDNYVRIWNAGTGILILEHALPERIVGPVVMTHDGRHLVGVSESGALRIWDCRAGTVVTTLPGNDSKIRSIVISANDNRVAVLTRTGKVQVWDVTTGARMTETDVGETIRALALNVDGSRLLGAGDELRLWSLDPFEQIASRTSVDSTVLTAAFSESGQLVATGSSNGQCEVWDLPNLQRQFLLTGHDSAVRAVAFRDDRHEIISGSLDKTVRIWDEHGGRPLAVLRGHTDEINVLSVGHNGQLVTGDLEGQIKVWNGSIAFENTPILQDETPTATTFIDTGSGIRIAWASRDHPITIKDVSTGQTTSLPTRQPNVVALAFSGNGERLASASVDGRVRIWSLENFDDLLQIQAAKDVQAIAFSPDDALLATAGGGTTGVQVWNAGTGELITSKEGRAPIAWSRDGQYLVFLHGTVVDSFRGELVVMDKDALQCHSIQLNLSVPPLCLGNGPMDHTVCLGTPDGQLLTFDVLSGKIIRSLRPFTNKPVRTFCFSPDYKRIAIFGASTSLWNISGDDAFEVINLAPNTSFTVGQAAFGRKRGSIFAIANDSFLTWRTDWLPE